ncbi:MAG: tetratricopeptide (TPR) repeat protein [Salibacteraceae bacterium]|jgi:tetratricopeptide (TPR) repeat protein
MEDHPDYLPFEDGNIDHLITKFEQMRADSDSYYFDVEEFEELIDFYLIESNQEAVELLISLAKGQHPDSISLQLKEAESLVYNEKASEALQIIEGVSLYEDSNPEFYFSKASIYSMADQKEKAIEILNRLVEISVDEDKVEAKMALAKEFQEIGDYRSSIKNYQEILSISASNEDALMEISLSCELGNLYPEGLSIINTFIDDNPYSHFAWFSLGNMHMTIDEHEEAITAYEYATLINEDFSEAFFNLGNAYMKMELFEKAIESYKDSITPHFVDPITYNFIGHCYIVLDKNEEAITYFKKAVEHSPEYADGWLGFAVAYSNLDQSQEGLLYLEKALKINPENLYYQYFHADLLVNLGDFESAEIIYEKVYQSAIENSGIFMDYSESLVTNGKWDEALTVLVDGISQYPEESTLYYKYAALLLQLGKEIEAESILFLALEINPKKSNEFLDYYPEAVNFIGIMDLLANYK